MTEQRQPLRSKVLAYFLANEEPNLYIQEAVHSIVQSDLECKRQFRNTDQFSEFFPLFTQVFGQLARMVTPETKVWDEPVPEQEDSSKRLLLKELHSSTRDQLIDSFFENKVERSAPFVQAYCSDDVSREQDSAWSNLQPRALDLAMKGLKWYLEVVSAHFYGASRPKEPADEEEHEEGYGPHGYGCKCDESEESPEPHPEGCACLQCMEELKTPAETCFKEPHVAGCRCVRCMLLDPDTSYTPEEQPASTAATSEEMPALEQTPTTVVWEL